jgi:hypothetical protein
LDEQETIAAIRDAVAVRDFEFDQEHCDAHCGTEGFTIEDAIRAVASGDVIDSTPERNRYLFCGSVSSLKQERRFHGQWLHVVGEYDEIVALATMYRPSIAEWRTERIRR